MKAKEFFGKFCSLYLWGNLLAMVLVIVGLCLGVKYGLEAYTHHDDCHCKQVSPQVAAH